MSLEARGVVFSLQLGVTVALNHLIWTLGTKLQSSARQDVLLSTKFQTLMLFFKQQTAGALLGLRGGLLQDGSPIIDDL